MIPDEFWEEIQRFKKKIVLISGGVDSTAIALEFFYRKEKCYYLHNNTGLVMKSSKDTMDKLYQKTKSNVIDFIKVDAQDYLDYFSERKKLQEKITVKNVIQEAFERADTVLEVMNTKGYYDRNIFSCCSRLKKNPMLWYLKQNKELFPIDETVIISGIASYGTESSNRKMRLSQIRNKDTFLRYHTSKDRWYAYPLRDFRKKEVTVKRLTDNGFNDVKESGCVICPVSILFQKYNTNPKQYLSSKKYYLKNVSGSLCSTFSYELDYFIDKDK